jgi:lipoate-protein ligase A
VGAISPTRFVNAQFEDLYDYDVLRRQTTATMFIVRLQESTLVFGGNQSADVVNLDSAERFHPRRRRGGGGLVLLQPDDLWVDWWIPAGDVRWQSDVRQSAIRAGHWWRSALPELVRARSYVHEEGLVGELDHRVVCFAGRGPGEVFVDERKAVGLTQWRVREGVLLSSVLHANSSSDVVDLLAAPPVGIDAAIAHHTLASLGIENVDLLTQRLRDGSGPWATRHLFLTA